MNCTIIPTQDKIVKTIDALKNNGFDVWFVQNTLEAEEVFFEEIFNSLVPKVISWGDSLTLHATKILEKIKLMPEIKVINTFHEGLSWREQIENRKKALHCDLFLTGTNAITQRGQLINLDMIGNRVAGIAFGPRKVVILVGVNKIVEGLDDAMTRIKSHAAPLNAKRHPELVVPCQKDGKCIDCNSPKRLCNIWTITEKSYPVGRIKIVFINQSLGY